MTSSDKCTIRKQVVLSDEETLKFINVFIDFLDDEKYFRYDTHARKAKQVLDQVGKVFLCLKTIRIECSRLINHRVSFIIRQIIIYTLLSIEISGKKHKDEIS